MDRTTRTAIILIGLGLAAAITSFMMQSWMLKKLPGGAAAVKAAVPAPVAPAPPPVVPKPLIPPHAPIGAPPPVSDSARACREKLRVCLTANGKELDEMAGLGGCYTLCVGAAGPCTKASCGDLCEASFGVRESCR